MLTPNYCPQATKQLANIKILQAKLAQELGSFNIDSERSEKIAQLIAIYQLRKEVKNNIKQLEQLIYPEYALAEKLKLQEQYDSQVRVLRDSGILKVLPKSKQEGIIGASGKEYPMPSYETMVARLKDPEKRKLMEKKLEQGFVKLQITPFAMAIADLIECYKTTLLKIDTEQKKIDPKLGIKATDGAILDLKTEDPLYVWSDLINCDKPNTSADKQMEYGVKNYDGKNKKARGSSYKSELLQNSDNAWQFSLIEDLPDLPAESQGQTIAGRKQFEANKTPKEYLAMLIGKPGVPNPHQGESGQTPESALITWLTYLQEKKQAIDDYQGKGKANWLVSTRVSGNVPDFSWGRDYRQPDFSGSNPDSRGSYDSFRSSARF